GAVIGERAEAQPLDAPLAVGRQLADTVVVARESGGREIVDARLDPFDGEPRYDRGDGRHYVPGINRHLVAEASADVTADHANLALGNPREHRKDRTEQVRDLRGHVHREEARRLVEGGDTAAGLERTG